MKEFLGRKGNICYLINQDFDEAYSFNTMGKPLSSLSARSAIIESKGILKDINIVSILGTKCGKQCEVYFDGYACKVNCNYISAFSTLRDTLQRADPLLYKIDYPSDVIQILIPIKPNSSSRKYISTLIPVLNWRSLLKD